MRRDSSDGQMSPLIIVKRSYVFKSVEYWQSLSVEVVYEKYISIIILLELDTTTVVFSLLRLTTFKL